MPKAAAPKNAADVKKEQVAKASKMINRALVSIHRIGNLKGLESSHISKAEDVVTKNVTSAFNKLKNPTASKDVFTL